MATSWMQIYLSDAEIANTEKLGNGKSARGNCRGSTTGAPHFSDGWQLGRPDLVAKMPQSFQIRAEGEDIYQCFVLPLNSPNGANVAAVKIHPGNRKVVHHSILYL
jgi:hypothetical protein